MSVAGVARDLAARLGVPFTLPSPAVDEVAGDRIDHVTIEVEAPDLCGRFAARVLRGVSVGPSDMAIARRLTLLGMRPINSLVDAPNYVMPGFASPTTPTTGPGPWPAGPPGPPAGAARSTTSNAPSPTTCSSATPRTGPRRR
jgi:hypothetical protein